MALLFCSNFYNIFVRINTWQTLDGGGVILPSKLEEADITSLRNRIAALEERLDNGFGKLTQHRWSIRSGNTSIRYPKNSIIWIKVDSIGGGDGEVKLLYVDVRPDGFISPDTSNKINSDGLFKYLHSHSTGGISKPIDVLINNGYGKCYVDIGDTLYRSIFLPVAGTINLYSRDNHISGVILSINIWSY